MFGDRGTLIRLAFGLLIPYAAVCGMKFRKIVFIACAGLLVGVALIIFPYLRSASYIGAEVSPGASLERGLAQSSEYQPGTISMGGKHTFIAAAVISGADLQTNVNLGVSWLHPMVNFVPRIVWPEKPSSFGNNLLDFSSNATSVRIPAGSAATRLADAFAEFWYFSIALWLLFGYWSGKIFGAFVVRRDEMSVILYFSLVLTQVHFVTQGFRSAFYTFVFAIGPVLLLIRLKKMGKRNAESRHRVPPENLHDGLNLGSRSRRLRQREVTSSIGPRIFLNHAGGVERKTFS